MVDLLHLTHDGGIRLSTYLLPSPQGYHSPPFYYCQLLAIYHSDGNWSFFQFFKRVFLQLRFTDIFWDRANIPSMVVHHLVNKFE